MIWNRQVIFVRLDVTTMLVLLLQWMKNMH